MKGTHLDRLVGSALQQLAARATFATLAEVQAKAKDAGPVRGFARAIRAAGAGGAAIIAEIKRKSPSKGELNTGIDAAPLASAYARGGAACLSVLTDGTHFGGTLADLKDARAACAIPLLRKDFLVTPYQLHEARAHGADAVLLIAAALEPKRLLELRQLAKELSLDVLVEVHEEAELEAALACASELVGVNARNLKTLAVDGTTFGRLAPLLRAGGAGLLVAESGVRSADDVGALAALGADAFLVGEALSTAADPESATRALSRALSGCT